jgi:large subunit ribosomal protein L4
MQITVYNLEQKETEKMDVPDALFGVSWKPELVKQAIVAQQANAREKSAHVKDRGEVRGGGKKPWKQKGTGRARHGSIRSPLWIGGGVTHGPTAERSFEKKINKKMRLGALLSLLSHKFNQGNVLVVEGIGAESMAKSKDVAAKTKTLREKFGTIAFVTGKEDKKIFLASRNIPKVSCIAAKSLNVADLAKPKGVIIAKQAIPEIVEHFLKKL